MHVLLAADADWVINEVVAAVGDADTSFSVVRSGYDVTHAVKQQMPDLAVLDLQIGYWGGMVVTMSLRLDESVEALPPAPVLMLLDRLVDVNLARRSGADGWLVKPLDPLRLRRAAKAIAAGATRVGSAFGPELPRPEVSRRTSASSCGDSAGLGGAGAKVGEVIATLTS